MDFYKKALEQAKKLEGKIGLYSKVQIKSKEDLATAYTPGVAAVSQEIAKNKQKVRELTSKGNSIAVISDGTSVLGLGDIGPLAALPVIEGKCLLFKEFAGIDAFPLVLGTKETNEIVTTVRHIAPSFGGINLEDISAPRCFEIEEKLQDTGIPVFHDDQHGTAIVILAALTNALKVVGKEMPKVKVVILGAGAAGIATAKIISPGQLVLIDSKGPLNSTRKGLNRYKKEITKRKNYLEVDSLEKAFRDADVFIGVSGKGKLPAKLINLMKPRSIIFALSNPSPEIMPDRAKAAGAAIVATGRSDFPNQINNVLVFPGIFRGALDNKVRSITDQHKIAAAQAIASLVKKPASDKIIPSVLDKRLVPAIARVIR